MPVSVVPPETAPQQRGRKRSSRREYSDDELRKVIEGTPTLAAAAKMLGAGWHYAPLAAVRDRLGIPVRNPADRLALARAAKAVKASVLATEPETTLVPAVVETSVAESVPAPTKVFQASPAPTPPRGAGRPRGSRNARKLAHLSDDTILQTIKDAEDIEQAAQDLGVTPTTVTKELRRMGIKSFSATRKETAPREPKAPTFLP